MKKKNCKLTGILRVIALPLVGSAGGWLYYRYVGCTTGTCAVTEKKQAETLQKLIEQALAADVG